VDIKFQVDKNEYFNNEQMSEAIQMEMIPSKSTQFGGFGMTFQIRGVPPQFVLNLPSPQLLSPDVLSPKRVSRRRKNIAPNAGRGGVFLKRHRGVFFASQNCAP
jgi:hypothetical protein